MDINRYRREKCEENSHTVQGWEGRGALERCQGKPL